MDFSVVYQMGHGASFRRESFGGIVYHYEGNRPDPRLFFVPSSFLMGLLEHISQAPLRILIDEAQRQFAMPQKDVEEVERFFEELARCGAIESLPC